MSDTNINALPIGHTLDGYRILRLLGAGGFGITYLAEEAAIGRRVAIKEYLPQGFAARAADRVTVRAVSGAAQRQFAWGLDRFRQEAATLVAFEHPNIVSVFRYFEAHGTAYLVMQYVEGMPLDALLEDGGTLSEPEIEEVILPILGGLEQVHAAHFLHRDIKPANIYIRKDGRPVLLDFGAARQAFGSETKSITAIVSEGYAPFEQYEARGDQVASTDIYAIGAVLYRCMTGAPPPPAPGRASARLRGARDPMTPARESARGRYSARLLAATDRALSTMPDDRPQSVSELRALLGGAANAPVRPIDEWDSSTAPPASEAVPTITAGAAKRARRLPLAAGVGGALLALAFGGYFVLAPKPPAPSTAATPGTPTTSAATPTQPSPDEIAQRAANEAEAKAEADLAAIKEAIGRGELERPRSELAGVIARIEEALGKRPTHAGLMRVNAAAREIQADLAARIAARVQELLAAAEREAAHNFDEALRLIAEAERFDPDAAKPARERIEAIRRVEEEKGRKGRVELHVSLARYHFEQARSAADQKRHAAARRLADQAKTQLARASEALTADPKAAPAGAAPAVKDLRREVEAFEQDLAKRITAHVASLLDEARANVIAGDLDKAMKQLEEVAELEPGPPALADVRRQYDEARKKRP